MKDLSYVKTKLIQEKQFIQTNPKIKDLGILGSLTHLAAKWYLTLQILLFTSFVLTECALQGLFSFGS
ncbi:MAG TPA: hypothetical protein PK079_12940 [Leptospiraceae bacterium]|nr:hypothetical protein [Leptospiraceae bacterium]HMW04864.1 hypothetical protein [Leptospiraceae bacterium]HMX32547.1 hypothetical protein [Leptospiraceae bacterium]HMY30915.1 hypothetical protein [Leptospiraceae bacterium]HMZ62719.1 hypothetical protein [Leptospiraceae bacterium]